MQFSISADTIKALLVIAAKKDTRDYLNSVCIDVRESDAVAVVTDGHKLLAVALTATDDAPALVPGQYIIRREALEGVKAVLKRPITVTIDPTTRTATIDNGSNFLTHSPFMDDKYPDWRKVVPLTVSGEVAQFNADYIGAFGKVYKLLGGAYSPAIQHNGDAAARVILPGDAVGVLMPMRGDPQPLDNPAWLGAPSAIAAAEAA
jgi:DNA polymerase III sliding clamp (beta) subunit (PCNA family)